MPKLLDSPNCSISRSRKGGRATLTFTDGDCVLLDWVEVQIEQARAVMTKRRKALRQLAKSERINSNSCGVSVVPEIQAVATRT